MPTSIDCSSITSIEAFAYGLPCIATDVGGLPSLISHNKNGFLFKKNEYIDQCISIIQNFYTKPEIYRTFSANAFNEYEKKLNWHTPSAKIIDGMKAI